MTDNRAIIPNPEVVFREELDNWGILFNPDTSDALGINSTGIAIWSLIDGKVSQEDIAARLKQDFIDAPDSLDEEAASFIGTLLECGFAGYETGN